MTIFYSYMNTPIGELLLAGDGDSLHLVSFPEGKMSQRHEDSWQRLDAPFAEARRQLEAYFAGELQQFDLPLAPQGTAFQQRVWAALRAIPYGATRSYGDIATQVGNPKAGRAVGAANGRNPIPIIIPCHRVIGSNGSLTGFGGGLPVKQALLQLEQQYGSFQLE